MRKWIVLAAGIALLVLVNVTIVAREHLVRDGRVALLELAPVDPRSLMQGDYMALRFRAADDARTRFAGTLPPDGHLVMADDSTGVATARRIDNGSPLAAGEWRLRYRVRRGAVNFGTNAYFFAEGTGHRYEGAKFGEFRVAPDGEAILTGLRDARLQPL